MNRARNALHFSPQIAHFFGTFAPRFVAAGAWFLAVSVELPAAENPASASVFDGPPCAYSSPFDSNPRPEGTPLRTFQVEERAGATRIGELVRVPLFFAENECRELAELSVVSADADTKGSSIVWQADDIRHGPDGGISRVHLWLAIDLKPGETKHFNLVKTTGRATQAPVPDATTTSTQSTPGPIDTATGPIVFGAAGELISLRGEGAAWDFGERGLFPSVSFHFSARENQPAADVVLDRTNGEREAVMATGPLFTKVRVRVSGPFETRLEQTYQIPKHGREWVVSTAIFPGPRGGTIKENRLLEGKIAKSTSEKITLAKIPAGLTYAIRAEHAYTISVLNAPASSEALLAIPLVVGGSNGTWTLGEDGSISLNGQRGLQRGGEGEKDTLYGYWTQVRLLPAASSDPDRWWQHYRENVQPLVAVVEEPGATVDRLHAALRQVVKEMKPVGWRQDAGRAEVLGDHARALKILQHGPSPRELDRENLLRGARGS
jgi:hypothetical protein